ncbi:MAG TPA: hypothetical protein PK228_20415 [Saprospiraceae bacterium]|nr:hypothetical protein [Saprospiraceae bacterium]
MRNNIVQAMASMFLAVMVGPFAYGQTEPAATNSTTSGQYGSYAPSSGFRLVNTDKGTVNLKIFTYLRYLNQLGLDSTYTNSFGTTSSIDRRQDIQLNKVNIQFLGWFVDPRLKYLLYVWTNNTAQGQSAQVVVGGNLTYAFSKYLALQAGIVSLPGVRTTEGTFPYWNTIDNRLVADEFFRPSYTTGITAKGALTNNIQYNLTLGNNLSQLGVDAGQLDDGINTFSGMVAWFPTTGEYGINSSFGDFENHRKIATRLAGHFSHSKEDRQGVPSTEAFENVTIRLSDGSVIFAPNLFGPGIQLDNATYRMISFDAGAKYKGFALEGEYYVRRVNKFSGRGVETLSFNELNDNGFQLQASAMILPQTLQAYTTYSKVFGEYGDPWDFRVGLNWYPWKAHSVRFNMEYIQTEGSPVGGLSLPLPVGATGGIFYTNFMVNF